MTSQEKAEQLHKKVNTFVLSAIGQDGYPLTKAVVPGKHRESIDALYFCTNTSSKFVAAIAENPKSGVYFYKRSIVKWQGCYLKGNMAIVSDMGVKEKYWDEKFKDAYEQKSFTDPDFCLLRFTPSKGRFYANYTITDFEL